MQKTAQQGQQQKLREQQETCCQQGTKPQLLVTVIQRKSMLLPSAGQAALWPLITVTLPCNCTNIVLHVIGSHSEQGIKTQQNKTKQQKK